MMLIVHNSLYLQHRNLFGKETFLTVYSHLDFHTCQALLSICQTERYQSLLLQQFQQQIEFLKHCCFLCMTKKHEILRYFLFLASFLGHEAKLSAKKPYVKFNHPPNYLASLTVVPPGGRQNLDDFRGFSMRRSDPMVTKGGPGRRERAPRRGPVGSVLLPGGCVVSRKWAMKKTLSISDGEHFPSGSPANEQLVGGWASASYRWELSFSGCKWVAGHFIFLVRLSDKWRGIHIICRDGIVES